MSLREIGEREKAEGRVTLRNRAGDNFGGLVLDARDARRSEKACMPGQDTPC